MAKREKKILITLLVVAIIWFLFWGLRFHFSKNNKNWITSEKKKDDFRGFGKNKGTKKVFNKEESITKKEEEFITNEEFQKQMKNIEGAVLLMVGWRPKVLKEVLYSVSEVRNKSGFLFLSSHDGHNLESEELIDAFAMNHTGNGEFEGVVRVQNIYKEYYLSLFDKKKEKAYFTKALKCHWFFAMKFAFDVLNLPFILYLEDDFIVSPDLLLALKEILKHRERLCDAPDCFINMGCRDDCWNTKSNDPRKIVYFPGPGNTGVVIFNTHYQKMKENSYIFCNLVEDGWDISLREFLKRKLFPKNALTFSLTRVEHIDAGSIRDEIEGTKDVTQQRIDILKRYKNLGLDKNNIDLSKKKKAKIKRKGPKYEHAPHIKMCERKYSKLCNFIASYDLEIEKWKKVENLYIPQIKKPNVKLSSLNKDKDDCWD